MHAPSVERLPSGVWSIPVPIPDNPLGHTLVHLLEDDTGPVLVDAGWDDPASMAALEAGLKDAGTTVAEVVGVLVTHHHPDHHGLSGRVRERSGCWIAMHHEDVEVVRRHREFLDDPREFERQSIEALHAAGATEEEVATLQQRSNGARTARPAVPDRTFEDDELIRVGRRAVTALWTPGHSPGHTCFWLPDTRQLLAGDHLLPTITPHVGLYEEDDPNDPLGAYLTSLDRIAALDPAEVLPAHQYRFDRAGDRVVEIQRHHRERLDGLLHTLDRGDLVSLWDLTVSMAWNRPWDQIPAMMRRVALSEARAHVRHLERSGLVESVPGPAVAYRLTPAGRERRS